MFGFLRSRAVLPLLMLFVAEEVVAQSTNKVTIDSPSVTAGQQGVVTISVSNDEPMTLLSFDLTFDAAFCGDLVMDSSECVAAGNPSACCTDFETGNCGPKLERLPDRVRVPLYDGGGVLIGYSPVSPQEGGDRCPTEGKMSFIFLDGSFTGNPIIPKCTCVGDADKSGFVNILDYAQIDANFFQPGSPDEGLGDANCSGFVNILDYANVDATFFTSCPANATGGAIAQWIFDVRSDATLGAVPVAVTVNDSTNGPVTLCAVGGSIDPPTACTTAIGAVGGAITINGAP